MKTACRSAFLYTFVCILAAGCVSPGVDNPGSDVSFGVGINPAQNTYGLHYHAVRPYSGTVASGTNTTSAVDVVR